MNAEQEQQGAPAGLGSDLAVRQWCVAMSVQWCKAGEDTTSEMIESAAMIERYVRSGDAGRLLDVGTVRAALEDALRWTPGVSRGKARQVCERVAGKLGLAPGVGSEEPPAVVGGLVA